MLTLSQFEQKFPSNIQSHRWLTLFCSSCTYPSASEWVGFITRRLADPFMYMCLCLDMCGHGCTCCAYWLPVSSVLSSPGRLQRAVRGGEHPRPLARLPLVPLELHPYVLFTCPDQAPSGTGEPRDLIGGRGDKKGKWRRDGRKEG